MLTQCSKIMLLPIEEQKIVKHILDISQSNFEDCDLASTGIVPIILLLGTNLVTIF
jgi:hypothetical protein